MNTLEVKREGDRLIISLPLQRPTTSASGKTRVIATTHGNVPTTIEIEGRPVIIGVNAYIK